MDALFTWALVVVLAGLWIRERRGRRAEQAAKTVYLGSMEFQAGEVSDLFERQAGLLEEVTEDRDAARKEAFRLAGILDNLSEYAGSYLVALSDSDRFHQDHMLGQLRVWMDAGAEALQPYRERLDAAIEEEAAPQRIEGSGNKTLPIGKVLEFKQGEEREP